MPNKHFDALVIGSGAVGSFAAKELTERGMEVLLLEAGRNITEEDFNHIPSAPKKKGMDIWEHALATLEGQPIQSKVAFFGKQFKPFFANDWKNPYTSPKDAFYLWIRGWQLGGRLHAYGHVLLRMTDYDFKAASIDGHGEHWPICYNDLASYCDRVEEFLSVYRDQDDIANLPAGKYFKRPKLTSAEKAVKVTVEESFPDRSVISWRYAGPNPKRVPLPILAAKQTGRLTIRTDAVVQRITVDPGAGKATGAEFIDRLTRKPDKESADVVVLCASTIESIRLLLNSACPRYPDGLANSSAY